MDLTIIIVSYNVKHFLAQCLDSVLRATKSISAEIIVIDNHSSDGTAELIQSQYPSVQFISNPMNVGFGKANNQALKKAKGNFTLFLNPDTIVAEDCFEKCITFFKQKADSICSLGIKMIDGSGEYLPESKRSFPSPEVAFYKLFGLAYLFPEHKEFGKYHLGYLNKDENHQIEVISGAFLLVDTKRLTQKGGFDEEFFMYGEDIDLSHRLLDNGCSNWYFAESTVLHYKGESTKKGSLNYVKNFYEAMIIFARKHLQSGKAGLFIRMMKIAIYTRGLVSFLASSVKKIGLQLIDTVFILLSMLLAKNLWEQVNPSITEYPDRIFNFNFPIYLLVFLFTMYFSGAYDKPYRVFKIIRGSLLSAAIIFIFYLFFPEQYQFSRFFIILSALFVGISYTLVRMIVQYNKTNQFSLYGSMKKRVVFVGDESTLRLKNEQVIPPPHYSFLGLINNNSRGKNTIGKISNLEQIIQKTNPTDVILDTAVLSYKTIISIIEWLQPYNIRCHTALQNEIIISSHQKDSSGSAFEPEKLFSIAKTEERRKKRLLDLFSSILFILVSPVLVWFQKKPAAFLKNCFWVLLGEVTWVGYNNDKLPRIKTSVIQVSDFNNEVISNEIEMNYARYYSVYEDIDILQRNWRQLGTKPSS